MEPNGLTDAVMFRNLCHEMTLPWHPSVWSVDEDCWTRHRPVQVLTCVAGCSQHKLHPHPILEDHALGPWSTGKINQFEKHSSQRGRFWNHHLWMGRRCRVVWMRGCRRVCLGPVISVSSSNTLETQSSSLHPMHWIRNPGVGPRKLCFNKPPRWFSCKPAFKSHWLECFKWKNYVQAGRKWNMIN